MDDFHGTRTTQEFLPHLNWTEDSMGHYLSVHLPGFKKEEVMVGLAYPGYVTISGERIVNDDKCIYVSQPLRLPENLDMNKIGQTLEDEMLCLTFPKRVEKSNEIVYSNAKERDQEQLSKDENARKQDEQHDHNENEKNSKQTDDHVVGVHKAMKKKGSILETFIDLLKNNVTFTVVLAFSLGAFIFRRFESNG